MTDIKQDINAAATAVYNKLIEAGAGDKVSLSEIESVITNHHVKYRVPIDKAANNVQMNIINKLGLTVAKNNVDMKLGEIPVKADLFVNTKGKVVKLFEVKNEKVKQNALIADETGTRIIKTFHKTCPENAPLMELGTCYSFNGVTTSIWEGSVSLIANSKSIITVCEDLDTDAVISGVIINLFDDSGLVKRCGTCKRILQKGICPDHGKQDGTYDLRIKGTVDIGSNMQVFQMDAKVVEAITGINVAKAQKIAMDKVDPTAVHAEIVEMILGKYFTLRGELRQRKDDPTKRTMFVREASPMTKSKTDMDDMRARIVALGGV